MKRQVRTDKDKEGKKAGKKNEIKPPGLRPKGKHLFPFLNQVSAKRKNRKRKSRHKKEEEKSLGKEGETLPELLLKKRKFLLPDGNGRERPGGGKEETGSGKKNNRRRCPNRLRARNTDETGPTQ